MELVRLNNGKKYAILWISIYVLIVFIEVLLRSIVYSGLLAAASQNIVFIRFGGVAYIGLYIYRLVSFALAACYLFIWYKRLVFKCNRYKEFSSMLIYGHTNKVAWYALPKKWSWLLAWLCVVVMFGALLGPIFLIVNGGVYLLRGDIIQFISSLIDSIARTFNIATRQLAASILLVFLIILILPLVAFIWFYRQYKFANKNSQQTGLPH